MPLPGAVNILIPRLARFSLITCFIEPLSDDAAIIQSLPDGICNNPDHLRLVVRLRRYSLLTTGQSSGGYFHPFHQRQHTGLRVTLWLAQLASKGIDKPRGFIAARGCYSVIKRVLQFSRNAESYQVGFTH